MRRLPSRFILATWAGFCSVSALNLLLDGAIVRLPFAAAEKLAPLLPVREPMAIGAADAVVFSALLIGITILLAFAIDRLGSGFEHRAWVGEQFAAAALTATFAFFVASSLVGSPAAALFGNGVGVCFALAATLGILLFDHTLNYDDGESDRAFEDAMARIEDARRRSTADRNFDHRNEDRP